MVQKMASSGTWSYDSSQHKAALYLHIAWHFGTHKKKNTLCSYHLTNENVRQGGL